MPELESLTLLELKKLAKENNIRNISKLKKEELIEVLKSIQNSQIFCMLFLCGFLENTLSLEILIKN